MSRALLAGVLGFVAACAAERATRPAPAAPLPSNQAAGAAAALADGEYHCRQRSYGWFRCVVRSEGGTRILEKTGGSQRIRGVIEESGDGFTLEGEFFCPYGSCDQTISTRFEPSGEPGADWEATFPTRSGPVTIYLAAGPLEGGAAGYGGATYGGAIYGYGGW